MANIAYNLSNPIHLLPAGTTGALGAWFNAVYLRLTNGIKFSRTASGNQSIPDTTATKVLFATAETDTVGGWDTTNNRYVIQTQGTYLIVASVLLSVTLQAGELYGLLIYKNGAVVANNVYSSITAGTCPNTVIAYIDCVQKDYLEIFISQTSGGSVNTNGSSLYTRFQGHRIN